MTTSNAARTANAPSPHRSPASPVTKGDAAVRGGGGGADHRTGSRAIEDSQRISIRQDLLHGLMVEADHCARQQGSSAVSAAAVERAITAQINRADRLRGRLQEQILRDTVRIDCSGQRVGQINGLAVLSFGNFLFGHPSRITRPRPPRQRRRARHRTQGRTGRVAPLQRGC